MVPSLRYRYLHISLLWAGLAACQPDSSLLPDKKLIAGDVKQTLTNYRIRRIVYEGTWAIGATTELAYVSGLKLAEARYVGHDFGQGPPVSKFSYNVDNQLISCEYRYPKVSSTGVVGELTTFDYVNVDADPVIIGTSQVMTQTYYVASNQAKTLFTRTVTVWDNNGITGVRRENTGTSYVMQRHWYTMAGGNLLTITPVDGLSQKEKYSFDDRPNPFFGLYGPDVTPVRRYSRNNVTGTTISQPDGSVQTYAVDYDYNSVGLPITAKSDNGLIRFEYEAY